MDAVSHVIAGREQEIEGLERMVGASVVAHVAFIAIVVLSPAWWFGAKTVVDEGPIMTISLGGPQGPSSGGMTAIGARPIQAEAEIKKAIEPIRPPAARAPEMIEPLKNAPKKSDAKVQAPKDAKSRTPTKGAEVTPGSAVAKTEATRGQGFGLSAGGFGSGSYLDVADFCCPEYLAIMQELIKRNWDDRQQAVANVGMKFTIQRNGMLTDIAIERPSGYVALDMMADRALRLTRQLPPLPPAFTEPALTVHLVFEYRR